MNLVKMTKEAQEECDRFNKKHKVGTIGRITRDDGKVDGTCLKYPAQVMGSSAVAFFEGISGAYLLERFTPNEKANHDFGRELEQINVVPEKETNSLRDKVKGVIFEHLGDYVGDTQICDDFMEQVPEITDAVFGALGILSADQDKIGAKVVVNPKAHISLRDGMMIPYDVSKGVDLSLRDYDVSDYATVEELNEMPENEKGEKYEERF